MLIPALAAVALATIGLLFFLTWYHADNQPMFGPAKEGRVTFKMVLQGFFKDVRDLLELDRICNWARRLWAFFGPRITNRFLIATVFADLSIVASGQDVWAFIAAHPLIAGGVLLLNLLTPLSVNGAPTQIPPPDARGRGPGAELEAGAAVA